jgi:glutamate transport system permease protein
MIAVNFALSWFAVWLERRMRRSRRAPTPLDPQAIEQEGAPGSKVKLAVLGDQSHTY